MLIVATSLGIPPPDIFPTDIWGQNINIVNADYDFFFIQKVLLHMELHKPGLGH